MADLLADLSIIMSSTNPLAAMQVVDEPIAISWGILGPTMAVTILATLVVLSRLWTRLMITRATGLDDVVIVLSLVCP